MNERDLPELQWRKSSRSGGSDDNSDCVEIAVLDHTVMTRDSKDAAGPVLHFSNTEWTAFLTAIKRGRLC